MYIYQDCITPVHRSDISRGNLVDYALLLFPLAVAMVHMLGKLSNNGVTI